MEVLRAYFLGISVPFLFIDKSVSKMSAAQHHTVDRIGFVLASSYSYILSEPALDKRQSLDERPRGSAMRYT